MTGRHSAVCAPLSLSSILSIVVSALWVAGDPASAFGQQEAAPTDTTSSATPGAPGWNPADSDWPERSNTAIGQKFCFKPGGAKMTCRTTISGNWETGQQAVRLDLIEREGEGSSRLQLSLPVGLYLQAGVKLTIDQGAPATASPKHPCLTNTTLQPTSPTQG